MNFIVKCAVASFVALTPLAAQAQTAGSLLGSPVVAAGNIVQGAAGLHHQALAPTVTGVAPNIGAGLADGVTNGLANVGNGLTGTGHNIQANGVTVGGATTGGAPLVSVGASNPAQQGSVAALLNGHP
jgi:hypothetical protein